MNELKSCQCGVTELDHDEGSPMLELDGNDNGLWRIVCHGCGMNTGWHATEDDARRVWNTRHLAESKPVVSVPSAQWICDLITECVRKEQSIFDASQAIFTLLRSRTPSVGEVDLSRLERFLPSATHAGHMVRANRDDAYVKLPDLQALIKGGGL